MPIRATTRTFTTRYVVYSGIFSCKSSKVVLSAGRATPQLLCQKNDTFASPQCSHFDFQRVKTFISCHTWSMTLSLCSVSPINTSSPYCSHSWPSPINFSAFICSRPNEQCCFSNVSPMVSLTEAGVWIAQPRPYYRNTNSSTTSCSTIDQCSFIISVSASTHGPGGTSTCSK